MTRREQVAAIALAGATDAEIAARLGISPRTVRALLARLRASGAAIPSNAERRAVLDGDGSHGASEPALDDPREGA